MSLLPAWAQRWWRRHRLATLLPRGPQRRAAGGFAGTVAGAVIFVWAYAAGDATRWEGAGLGLALAGLAYGFAAWSSLLPDGQVVEERQPMEPSPDERAALARELERPADVLVATALPRRMLALALTALGAATLVPLRSLVSREADPPVDLARTPWRRGVRAVREDGAPVRVEDLVPGAALTVFPEGHVDSGDSSVILVRVDPAELVLPSDRMGWTVDGVVGYSKICTHAGCPVGLYVAGAGELMCPCHQSTFDVRRGAAPRYGPAARALPQLPLGVGDDGTLVALGDFPDPVGPGYWRQS